MIKIKKTCTAVFMKTKNSLVVPWREKYANWNKSRGPWKLFFNALLHRFWLISKSCSWFNKVVHGQTFIKWTCFYQMISN